MSNLTFKKFIFSLKEIEAFNIVNANHEVGLFCLWIENNNIGERLKFIILEFNSDDLNIYFTYLYFKSKYNKKALSLHTKWLAENVSFEDLYKIDEKCDFISIDYSKIYIGDDLLLDLFN